MRFASQEGPLRRALLRQEVERRSVGEHLAVARHAVEQHFGWRVGSMPGRCVLGEVQEAGEGSAPRWHHRLHGWVVVPGEGEDSCPSWAAHEEAVLLEHFRCSCSW